jgi:hypothetical protein
MEESVSSMSQIKNSVQRSIISKVFAVSSTHLQIQYLLWKSIRCMINRNQIIVSRWRNNTQLLKNM